jgi:hypothetical protein
MKRDWDVLRSVLLEVEALGIEQAANFTYFAPHFSDDPEAIRARHAFMLHESGFLNGLRFQTVSEGMSLKAPELTMRGADLLDSVRSISVWETMKKIGREKGVGLAFDSLAGLAKLAIAELLGQ